MNQLQQPVMKQERGGGGGGRHRVDKSARQKSQEIKANRQCPWNRHDVKQVTGQEQNFLAKMS